MSRFYYANEEADEHFKYCDCPQEGTFIGWKAVMVFGRTSDHSCEFCLAKLKIPADSPRLRAYASKKCRCKFAQVLDIQFFNGTSLSENIVAFSMFELTNFAMDSLRYRTNYKKGEMVFADGWDDSRTVECGHGIHFFMNREDAISYVTLRV